jgi:hypothetical protein
MSHHPFGSRQFLRALTGLDFGLRVRVDVRPSQRTIFSGAENLSVQALTSELAEMVSSLRVYSYAVRGRLEEVTAALQLNIHSGSWRYARRAALDLSGLLAVAAKRRLADPGLCARGANCAIRIAELCAREAR